jgi:hypothetical protein
MSSLSLELSAWFFWRHAASLFQLKCILNSTGFWTLLLHFVNDNNDQPTLLNSISVNTCDLQTR